jgi:signal transduction histidine kinase
MSGRPAPRDVLLALSLVALAEAEIAFLHVDYPGWLYVVTLALGLSLIVRVRLPLVALATNIGGFLLINLYTPPNEDPITLALTLAIAVYSAGAHTRGRSTAAGLVLVASISVLGILADSGNGGLADVIGNAVFFVGIFGGVWLAGRTIRRRRARERELIVERDVGARAAVAEERARIARELHDVVAHAISVIVLQARGARHAEGAERDDALEAIESTGATALAEMRRLLHILRSDDEEVALTPQPSLAHLELLVAQVRDAGLAVDLRIEGERRELPPGVDVSAYRIVQEALTNALKHAGPARARVSVRFRPDALELEISDTGTGSTNGAGGGHGLAGMRERVAVFGGELASGPRPEGGFTINARLPL